MRKEKNKMLRDKIRCMQETKEIKQGGPITM